MAFDFNIIPEGTVSLIQVGVGDPSIVGRINLLLEISAGEGDDLDTVVTLPEGTPEQLREVFDYLAAMFEAIDVGYEDDEGDED